jgi:beta-carotene ketolase (CrtW type)
LRERFPTTLVFWALPALLSSVQLFYFGTYRPHRVDEVPFSDQHRARSNDFSPLMSLLTCFHFGYHHEHHDTPWVPWWRLPARRQSAVIPK